MLIREAFTKLDLEVELSKSFRYIYNMRNTVIHTTTVATFVILLNIVYKCTWPQEKLFRLLHVASHTTRKHLHAVYFR